MYKHFLKTINQAKANKQNITIYRKKNTYVLLLKKCDLSLELGQINDSTFKRTIEKAFLDRLDKSESASYIKIKDIIYVINVVPSEEKGGKQNARKQFG